MGPTVVTAVLLLVCLQVTVTEGLSAFGLPRCKQYPDIPCGDGWSRIDDDRCVKYIRTPKTWTDAEAHCRTLNGHLVSVHNRDDNTNLICLNWRETQSREAIWIGAQRSGGRFKYTDGSAFNYNLWFMGQPDNAGGQQDCIEMTGNVLGMWIDERCSDKNNFVCAKKM